MNDDFKKINCFQYDGTLKTATSISKKIDGIFTHIDIQYCCNLIIDRDKNLVFYHKYNEKYLEWNDNIAIEYVMHKGDYIYQYNRNRPIVTNDLSEVFKECKRIDLCFIGTTKDNKNIIGAYTPCINNVIGHYIISDENTYAEVDPESIKQFYNTPVSKLCTMED